MIIKHDSSFINLKAEARDYFNHNPKDTEVAFIMLTSDKLKDVRNDESIYLDEDDIFCTIYNKEEK